jgi:flagellar motility protein MotE (MotC chaperone)
MKMAVALVLFVLTFVATILLLLYFTGNLNEGGIARLTGGQALPAVGPPPAQTGVAEPLMNALREKEQELEAREAELEVEEKRLELMRKELETLRKNLDTILNDVNQSLDAEDQAQVERMNTVAESIASMEAKNAAETLTSDLFTPEEAAKILERIEEERVRGNILNEMTPEKAALVLQALNKRRYGS